MKDELES